MGNFPFPSWPEVDFPWLFVATILLFFFAPQAMDLGAANQA